MVNVSLLWTQLLSLFQKRDSRVCVATRPIPRSRLRVSFLSLLRAFFFVALSPARVWNFRKLTPCGLLRTLHTGSKNSTNVLQGLQEARDPKSYAVQNREGVFVRARYAKFLPFFSFGIIFTRARMNFYGEATGREGPYLQKLRECSSWDLEACNKTG